MKPEQADEARRMIYTVAHSLFDSDRTLEETIAQYREEWPLGDLDDIQRSYFDNGGVFLAVQDGGEIVGTGAIWRLEEAVCELRRFWFLPAYHGTGIGAKVLARLEATARAMGYRVMRLETSPQHQPRAYAFYKKHGFTEIPRYGEFEDDIGMEKKL